MRIWILAATAAVSTSAWAAETAPATAPAPAAQAGELLDITVTARRREESLKDVPIAVSALDGDALRDAQVMQVRDVAAYVPGLNINSDSAGRAFISMRGIGTTLIDTVQPGVGIFVDGVYQPNTSYLNTPLVDVARVEVLRGPQGTLFGNNTLGGAINVITRQPGNEFEGRADAAWAGPDDFRSISGSVGGALVEDVLQVRVAAAYHEQDGFMHNVLAGGPSNPLEQKSANATVRYRPVEGAQFTLNANWDRVFGGNTAYLGAVGPRDYGRDGATNQRSLTTLTYKGVNLKGEFDTPSIDTKITAIATFNRRDSESAGDGDFGPIDFFRSAANVTLKTTTGELRFDTTWSDSISTLVGLFTSDAKSESTGLTTVVPLGIAVPAAQQDKNKSQAVFATVFAKLSPTLDLAVGGRFDHQKLDSTASGANASYKADEFQPRVTLTKHFTPDVMGYASIAKGFRGGGQNRPGAPNLIYRGDQVWTYELGAKFTAFDRLEASTAVFYNDYDHFIGQNALAPSTTGAGIVAVNLNSGHVKSYGAEAEVNYAATDAWRLYGSLTLLHARITDASEFRQTTGYDLPGDHILFVPDWNFSVGSSYRWQLGANDALSFDLTEVGKGSRTGSSLDATVVPKLEAYYLTNASITWQHRNLSVAVWGTNLFDEDYIDSYIDRSALVRAGLGFLAQNLKLVGDGRRVGLRATVRF